MAFKFSAKEKRETAFGKENVLSKRATENYFRLLGGSFHTNCKVCTHAVYSANFRIALRLYVGFVKLWAWDLK